MIDTDCVRFLQWALPRLGLNWPGFRRVRGQVCKRIARRIEILGLATCADYRAHLEQHAAEWTILEPLCRVTITRFYRDRSVFEFLAREVLPAALQRVRARGDSALRVWSAGCASGEEPYTVSLLWELALREAAGETALAISATDADAELLQRAATACYPYSSVKNLPAEWRAQAFTQNDDQYCLRPRYRAAVDFKQQDVRAAAPQGLFDVVLCRNLAFTYFAAPLQTQTLARLAAALQPGGTLVIGVHEQLPAHAGAFEPWAARLGIYAKAGKIICPA